MDPTLDTLDGSRARQMFDRLLRDEPGMTLDAGDAARLGRRLRRRRQARYGAGALGVSAVLTAALVATAGTERSPTTTTRAGGASDQAGEVALPSLDVAAGDRSRIARPSTRPADSELAREIVAAVQASSPEGWSFDLRETDEPGLEGVLAGEVDDGSGAGSFHVATAYGPDISAGEPGITLHPCEDPDYSPPGAVCEETALAGGAVLSVMGPFEDQGIRYINVTLAHPDGRGLSAQSCNCVDPLAAPTPADDPGASEFQLRISRPHPVYTAEQLRDVVIAVDEALR